MTRHYATACRGAELPVLLASMRRHCRPFVLHVLAWDFDPFAWPCLDPDVEVTPRLAFLRRHPDYAADRLPGPPRSTIDTACTARWRFVADLVHDLGEPVCMVDGDVWFWSSPEPMFDEVAGAYCAAATHGFPQAALRLPGITYESHRKYGLYNAGLTYWSEGMAAESMAAMTREWSYTELRDRGDGSVMFGDQWALEKVMGSFGRAIRHPGVNLAPWNVHTRRIEDRFGDILVNGQPLIAYHYSSFRRGGSNQNADPHYEITPEQARILYEPYRRAWAEAERPRSPVIGPDHVETWR
jgi:hypothetical protein